LPEKTGRFLNGSYSTVGSLRTVSSFIRSFSLLRSKKVHSIEAGIEIGQKTTQTKKISLILKLSSLIKMISPIEISVMTDK
jgi:hypothetical protein